MKIAVLGRGESLIKYREYCSLFQDIFIVNEFNDEIKYLGEECFIKKNITHVVGLGKNCLYPHFYDKFNIKSVQGNCDEVKHYFKFVINYSVPILRLPSCLDGRGFPVIGWDIYVAYKSDFDSYKELINYIKIKYEKEIKDLINKGGKLRIWPTTGSLAIDLALTRYRPEEIHLFGFDFYEKDYMVQKKKEWQTGDMPESKMMKYFLQQLIFEFGETKFFYYGSFNEFNGNNFIKVL